ncbi:MAG: AI-2E family transporter [Planctomycetota bacterium]
MNEPPDEQDDSITRIQTICLITLTALAVTYTVYWLRPVLVPLVVAIFVVSGVSPILVTLEKRLGVNRLIAAALTFMAGVVLLGLFGFSIWASIIDLSKNSRDYQRRVQELVAEVEARIPAELIPGRKSEKKKESNDEGDETRNEDELNEADEQDPDEESADTRTLTESQQAEPGAEGTRSDPSTSPSPIDSLADTATINSPSEETTATNPAGSASVSAVDPTVLDPMPMAGTQANTDPLTISSNPPDRMTGRPTVSSPDPPASDLSASDLSASSSSEETANQLVDTFVRQGISVVSQAFISMVSTSVVVLIYVFFLLIGTPTAHHTETYREVDYQIRSYLALKTIISIFTGLSFGLALKLFGVPMSFTFGVMAFLLNFVPNVGPLVASLLPIPLILLDPSGSLTWMITTITVICAIQLISGNLVEPKIMGDSSDLHPVTILLALMFWGMMWGIIGMFLATPITAAVKIVLERIDQTKPLANLMAGRWGDESWSQQMRGAS